MSACPAAGVRRVYFDDPDAPVPAAVVPSAYVTVRGPGRTVLVVQRCDNGVWELPGGRVDIGESVIDAAVRETLEEAGILVRITGLVGLYSDPRQIVCATDGHVRQEFAVVFHAEPADDAAPRPDGVETRSAGWATREEIDRLPVEPATRIRIDHALTRSDRPHLG